MANDMSSLYYKLPTDSLKVLRSKKASRLQRLRGESFSFFIKREIATLEHQIHQIDVELTCRFNQKPLF